MENPLSKVLCTLMRYDVNTTYFILFTKMAKLFLNLAHSHTSKGKDHFQLVWIHSEATAYKPVILWTKVCVLLLKSRGTSNPKIISLLKTTF